MIAPRILSLIKVYETGSFTKAASLLGRTQPAVSQHICALESQLGITIFDRSHTPLTVTPEGMYVVACARKIVDAVDDLEETLLRFREGSRTLRVGLTSSEELYKITEAFSSVLMENENLSINSTRCYFKHMMTMLLHDELDMVISFGNLDVSADYGCKEIDRDRLMLAVSRKNPLSERNSVKLSDLVDEKLVVFSKDTGIGHYVDVAISSSELNFDVSNVRLVTDDINAIGKFCDSGKAISIIPEKAYSRMNTENTVLVPIEEFSEPVPVNIYFNVSTGFNGVIDRIIDHYSRNN